MHATRRGFFKYSYEITHKGSRVTDIADIKKEGCDFTAGGHSFRIDRQRDKRFVLKGSGGDLAVAERKSGKQWTISSSGASFDLVQKSFWRSDWEVHAGGRKIGVVKRESGRKSKAELPGDMAKPLQVFAFYMVLTIWSRADGHFAAVTGGGG